MRALNFGILMAVALCYPGCRPSLVLDRTTFDHLRSSDSLNDLLHQIRSLPKRFALSVGLYDLGEVSREHVQKVIEDWKFESGLLLDDGAVERDSRHDVLGAVPVGVQTRDEIRLDVIRKRLNMILEAQIS